MGTCTFTQVIRPSGQVHFTYQRRGGGGGRRGMRCVIRANGFLQNDPMRRPSAVSTTVVHLNEPDRSYAFQGLNSTLAGPPVRRSAPPVIVTPNSRVVPNKRVRLVLATPVGKRCMPDKSDGEESESESEGDLPPDPPSPEPRELVYLPPAEFPSFEDDLPPERPILQLSELPFESSIDLQAIRNAHLLFLSTLKRLHAQYNEAKERFERQQLGILFGLTCCGDDVVGGVCPTEGAHVDGKRPRGRPPKRSKTE